MKPFYNMLVVTEVHKNIIRAYCLTLYSYEIPKSIYCLYGAEMVARSLFIAYLCEFLKFLPINSSLEPFITTFDVLYVINTRKNGNKAFLLMIIQCP